MQNHLVQAKIESCLNIFICSFIIYILLLLLCSWEDETIGGLFKQSEASTSIHSDFTKISMYKLILLANSKAKSDYFVQRSTFVSMEGRTDVFAELSTNVEGKIMIFYIRELAQLMDSSKSMLISFYGIFQSLISLFSFVP